MLGRQNIKRGGLDNRGQKQHASAPLGASKATHLQMDPVRLDIEELSHYKDGL